MSATRVFRSVEGEESERGLECERGKEGRREDGMGSTKGREVMRKRTRKNERGGAGRGRGSVRQGIGERLIATPLGRKVFPTLPPSLYVPSRFTTP